MSSSKQHLKAAREALGKKDYDEAIKCCNRIILWESGNYNAYVFLGAAYAGLNNVDEAIKSYEHAIDIDKDQLLAWQGLISLHEKQGSFDKVLSTMDHILPKLALKGDGNLLVTLLNKKLDIYENKVPNEQALTSTLKLYLPGSQYYDLIKDSKNLPDKTSIYRQLINVAESNDVNAIETTYKNRRLRINAKSADTTGLRDQVESEIYSQSKLPFLYETLLDATEDPENIRTIQLKLLSLYRKQLFAMKDKSEVCEKISQLVHTLVVQDINDPLPYEISIEFTDVAKFEDYNENLIGLFIHRFPESAVARIIQGHQKYTEGDLDEAFDLFSTGLEQAPNILCGYLCLSWIYHDSGEFETGLEYATRGHELADQFVEGSGIPLDNMILSLETCMAHCYRRMDAKYYPDALTIYDRILKKEPNNMGALEGAGLILSQEGKYGQAQSKFETVLALDPEHPQPIALSEIGWIHAQQGDHDMAIDYLTRAIEAADGQPTVEYYFKLGCVYWMMGGEFQVDKEYAFKYFMQAVRMDPDYANAFTYLGHYYRSVQHDNPRAKKCYQKAYMLNPLDADAAFHLSNYYVADNENAQAEAIFEQVTNNNSKAGWAWRRLGYAHMKSNRYNDAITCFQKALRTDTGNVHCWEGLGEAYDHEGRYVAALKAFERSTLLDPTSVFGKYQKALVQQKVGMLHVAKNEFEAMVHDLTNESAGKCSYDVLPLKGLADTYLAQVKEDFQQGFFGRAADGCGKVIATSLQGLKQDPSLLCLWKAAGDACAFYRLIPSYLHLCNFLDTQTLMVTLATDAHSSLGFQADPTSLMIDEFSKLELHDDFSLPPQAALDVMLACASYCYKQVLVLCKNHRAVAPPYWHDLALTYFWMAENNTANRTDATALAIKCIRVALLLDPEQYSYWNAYGVMTMHQSPKISQYAFVKAMEYNNRSAVPWTNYGFLCLVMQDYDLANQAFDMAHVLDPEWVSAWVGQAYVASIWNTGASQIFQHAFESSNGSALDASYGYASTVFSQLSTQPISDDKDKMLLISPAFALQKLTEQTQANASALNLLGLLSERMGQTQRAAEAFAGAILALEVKMEHEQDEDAMAKLQGRRAQVHANLGRTLCAMGDFRGAIDAYLAALEYKELTSRVYCLLGIGVAHYFLDELEESLHTFETALNETADDIALKQDVVVLLSKVLWALGGDEQRAVAKDQLLSCIAESPHYLPAILSLAAMGILSNDATLTGAALEELIKIPADVAYDSDKEHWISWILSQYHKIQGDNRAAQHVILKSVHQYPWVGALWARLGDNAVENGGAPMESRKVLVQSAIIVAKEQHAPATVQSLACEHAASMDSSALLAQRAIMIAPWRQTAWDTLATVN
ncbi:TPR-like protein [Hesseltinella vesiculosa]|uniref:TPR-like protein n=1 Tax=Hesseltinella vesiculosa TaxID=101127 RepID=A0A1X2G3T7_9FUNG|nr:TPR-like protein [Hesseltinella vesiculosa]